MYRIWLLLLPPWVSGLLQSRPPNWPTWFHLVHQLSILNTKTRRWIIYSLAQSLPMASILFWVKAKVLTVVFNTLNVVSTFPYFISIHPPSPSPTHSSPFILASLLFLQSLCIFPSQGPCTCYSLCLDTIPLLDFPPSTSLAPSPPQASAQMLGAQGQEWAVVGEQWIYWEVMAILLARDEWWLILVTMER